MPRPARYDSDQIIAATAAVAAQHGPHGATIARIASALGAPTGSIYHRFSSRDVLLGEVWLTAVAAFQKDFGARLQIGDASSAGLDAACSVTDWVRRHAQDARILLLHRSEDFYAGNWPTAMTERARELRDDMSEALREFCRRLVGNTTQRSLRTVTFALAEAPYAIVRPHVRAGEAPPPIATELIEATYRGALTLLGVRS